MDQVPQDFREYWQETLASLVRYPACPELEAIPLRSTAFATLYGVRLTSVGPYRLFGYLSIPTGTGPFPAIYYSPKYQSVLALITAALMAGATHVVAAPALFYKTAELAIRTQAYPLEEINDYLRMFPARAEAVRRTLAYYDLRAFAPGVAATTLLMAGAPGTLFDGQALKPLVDALPGQVTVHESELSLYRDGLYAEQWMAAQCGISDRQSILPEHWRD